MKSAACAVFLAFASASAAQSPANPDALLANMERIIIPAIEFREANGMDVLHFLIEAATAADPHPPFPLSLIQTPEAETPRNLRVFETEDGASLHIPPLSLYAQRLSLLQSFDLLCEIAGLRFTIEPTGPEFFLPDGRRLVRKEIPAPADPRFPVPSDLDDWGFHDCPAPVPTLDFLAAETPFLDWIRSGESSPEAWESALAQLGFTSARHTGQYCALQDCSGHRHARLHPPDYIEGERLEETERWVTRAYFAEDGSNRGMAIFSATPPHGVPPHGVRP